MIYLLRHRSDIRSSFYLERYIKFIENRYSNKSGHNHHILPKKLYPQYKNFNEYPNNKVKLSPREHFIAHWLLWKALNNESMTYAFYSMRHKNGMKLNSRTYQSLLNEISHFMSEKRKQYRWINKDDKSISVHIDILQSYLNSGWKQGRHFSESHKKNISKAKTGTKLSKPKKYSKEGMANVIRVNKLRDHRGMNNGNSKPFQIDNIVFLTLKFAQEYHNISRYKALQIGKFVDKSSEFN